MADSSSSPSTTSTSSSSPPQPPPRTRQPKSSRPSPSPFPSSSSSSPSSPTAPSYDWSSFQLTDIGANLLDPMYSGLYHGSATAKHRPDIDAVLARAAQHGVRRIIVTAGTFEESKEALAFIQRHSPAPSPPPSSPSPSASSCPSSSPPPPALPALSTTCGLHPTRASSLSHLDASSLASLIPPLVSFIAANPSIVAIGECGLDGDRLHFSPLAAQLSVFPLHLQLSSLTSLPLFLHDRNVGHTLLTLLRSSPHPLPFPPGVVHSFTGDSTLLHAYLDLGFYIGLNGCSVREQGGLEVAREVPIERLLLETDAPWCEVKRTHAGWGMVRTGFEERRVGGKGGSGGDEGMVKGRNEPCKMVQVAEVVAAARGMRVEELVKQVRLNTDRLFFTRTPATRTPTTTPT